MEELANHLAAVKLESAEKIHALTVEVTTLRGANASNQELLEHCNTYIGQLKAENSTKFRVEERNDWKSLCTSIQKDRQRLHEQVDELERERAALRGQLQGGAAERGAASSSSSSTPPPAPTPVPGLSAAEAAAAPEPSAGGAAAAGAKTSASDTMAAAAEAAAAATEAPAAPVSATAGSSSSGAAAAGREAELLAAIEEMRRVERSLRFTVAQDRKRNIQLESDAKAHKRDVEAWRRECERLRVQAEGGSVFSSITRIFAAWRKQPPPARECPVNLV
jgi:hypothetical protein